MFLVDGFRRRAYERQYRAAWLLLLANYTYRQLSAADQQRVWHTTEEYLREAGWSYRVATLAPDFSAGEFLLTMHRLGIPPALPGLKWDVPNWVVETPIGPLGPIDALRLARIEWPLLGYYRPYSAATAAARRDLIARGASFPDPVDEMLKNRAVYLREYEKKHGSRAVSSAPSDRR